MMKTVTGAILYKEDEVFSNGPSPKNNTGG